MQKLSLPITIISFSFLLSFASGCSSSKKDQEVSARVKFEADNNAGTLDGKDKSFTISFNREVSAVSESNGDVKAVKEGNKVIFTQTSDWPDEDRKLEFTVKGADDNDRATVSITRKVEGQREKGGAWLVFSYSLSNLKISENFRIFPLDFFKSPLEDITQVPLSLPG